MDGTKFLDAEGEVTAPQDITAKKLRHTKKGSMFALLSQRLALRAVPLTIFLKNIWKTKSTLFDNLWVYYALIKPIDIKRNQFFGSTKLGKNKNFIGVREDVKATPITTFSYFGPQAISPQNTFQNILDKNNVGTEAGEIFSIKDVESSLSKNGNLTSVAFSVTPYEVVSHYEGRMSFDTIAPPNMAVEPLIFSVHPTKPSEWGSKEQPFSLEMLLGAATNMFSVYVKIERLGELKQIREVDVTGNGDLRKLMLGDGGVNLNNGIPNLVRKRVRKIVHVHFNMNPALPYHDIHNSTDLNDWMGKMGFYNNMFAGSFGIASGPRGNNNGYLMNKVFDDGLRHMTKLKSNLDSLFETGNPLVTTLENITVLDNPFWGTTAGDMVDLTFILFTLPGKFSSKIHRDAVPPPKGIENTVDLNGQFTNEELSTLPTIPMIASDKKAIIARGFRPLAVTVRQANMMAYLGSWIINQAWDKSLLGNDGNEKFGGFKVILEKYLL